MGKGSGGSKPSDKGGGWSQKKFFWALWASVWSKHEGEGLPRPSPGSAAEGSMQVTLSPTTTKQWLQARRM